MCAVQPRVRILNICEKFNKTFIYLIFEFKFSLRKLKIISFQKKSLVFISFTVIEIEVVIK